MRIRSRRHARRGAVAGSILVAAFSLVGLRVVADAQVPSSEPAAAPIAAELDANQIDRFARQTFGAVYGGISTPDDGKTVVVHLSQASPELASWVAKTLPASNVKYVLGSPTLQALTSLKESISAKLSSWADQGIQVAGYGDDIAAGVERVHVVDLTEQKASAMRLSMGASAPIEMVNEPLAEFKQARVAGRSDDTSPFIAGDLIDDNLGYCTSGFGVKVGSARRTLTAGHCFRTGNDVHVSGNGASIGYAMQRKLTYKSGVYNGHDTEILSGPSTALAWRSNSVTASIAGQDSSFAGYNVCQSGAITGHEVCPIRIRETGAYRVLGDDEGNEYQIGALAVASYSSQAMQQGDSGGPVYRKHAGTSYLYATGTSTGYGVESQFGGDVFYYTPLSVALDDYNATLITVG